MSSSAAGQHPADGATLTDGEIVLRPPTRYDAGAIVEAVRSSLDHLRPWMFWAHAHYGSADAAAFLHAVEEGHELAFLVLDRKGGLHGMCSLNDLKDIHRTANLGYWLRRSATGAGTATRAARLCLIHGLRDLRLERIEVVMSVANPPSRRVAERLGLAYEGTRRRALRIGDEQHDAHVFAATRDDLELLVPTPFPASPAR